MVKDTSFCPLLVHDSVATLSASDRITGLDFILGVTLYKWRSTEQNIKNFNDQRKKMEQNNFLNCQYGGKELYTSAGMFSTWHVLCF